jgi:hypothetical protein
MKINNRVFVSFAITLQILMLLFAISAIPAAAVEETPSLPLVLQGTVELDGEPAPVNTEITAKVNGDVVGTTEVDQEGVYGSQPGTKLYITCEPDNYEDIKFYVNGVESQLVDVDILKNANSGVVLESVNMVVTSPVDDGTGDDGTDDDDTGGSGGFGYRETATTSDPGTDDESSSGSTASASTTSLKSVATTQSTDDSAEEVPASETGSSMMVIVIGAIILLGIIVTVGYKLKKN